MVAKKVLWVSRHTPGDKQFAELRRLFGSDVWVQQDSRPISYNDGAGDVLGRMRAGGYDEVVLVAPISILDELCRQGVNPLWPRMDESRRNFLGFDRILGVRKEFEEMTPEASGHKRIMWLSRFAPAGRQVPELQRLFGSDVDIVHDRTQNVEEAAERFFDGGFQYMVAIVPMAVLERLSAIEEPAPLRILWSEAIKEDDPRKVEFRGAGGQGFRFDRYRKVSVKVESKRL